MAAFGLFFKLRQMPGDGNNGTGQLPSPQAVGVSTAARICIGKLPRGLGNYRCGYKN